MPWVSATTIFGTVGRSGIDAGLDGIFTLVVGVGIAVLDGSGVSGWIVATSTKVTLWLALGIFGAVWVVDFLDFQDRIGNLDSELFAGSIGAGMWVMLIGGIVAVVCVLNLKLPPKSSSTKS